MKIAPIHVPEIHGLRNYYSIWKSAHAQYCFTTPARETDECVALIASALGRSSCNEGLPCCDSGRGGALRRNGVYLLWALCWVYGGGFLIGMWLRGLKLWWRQGLGGRWLQIVVRKVDGSGRLTDVEKVWCCGWSSRNARDSALGTIDKHVNQQAHHVLLLYFTGLRYITSIRAQPFHYILAYSQHRPTSAPFHCEHTNCEPTAISLNPQSTAHTTQIRESEQTIDPGNTTSALRRGSRECIMSQSEIVSRDRIGLCILCM
jgi:hypothetical protein